MALETPTFFDWIVRTDNSGMNASIQSDPDGGVFDFAAPATLGGVLLEQGQFLPPGWYHLVGKSAELEQGTSARPYWSISCANGQEQGRVEVPNSSVNGGNFSGDIFIKADCSTQSLRLIARPSSEAGGLTGQIKYISLTPKKTH